MPTARRTDTRLQETQDAANSAATAWINTRTIKTTNSNDEFLAEIAKAPTPGA